MKGTCIRCGKDNPAEVHTCTPKALVLADELERHIGEFETATRASAELRRLHAALEMNARTIAMYENEQLDDEALLRQALDCLEWYADIGINGADKIIDAIKERLA
jgi:hypothetical protein